MDNAQQPQAPDDQPPAKPSDPNATIDSDTARDISDADETRG